MSDIGPGDVVVGVPASQCSIGGHGDWVEDHYVTGRLNRVLRKGILVDRPALWLKGHEGWWCAGCFRKIKPADPEFFAAIKRVSVLP